MSLKLTSCVFLSLSYWTKSPQTRTSWTRLHHWEVPIKSWKSAARESKYRHFRKILRHRKTGHFSTVWHPMAFAFEVRSEAVASPGFVARRGKD